jgi:hypothetical protein
MIATDLPAAAKRAAREGPAWPPPITMASYLRFIKAMIPARNEPQLRYKRHELGVDLVEALDLKHIFKV